MAGEDVLTDFWNRMSKCDNDSEWKMRMCVMGKEADAEKEKRRAA